MNKIVEEIHRSGPEPAQQTERGWMRTFIFGPSFLGFQGHFPGQPVLPAVVQIMILRESIIQQLQRELDIAQIARAKFLKVILPNTTLVANWTIKELDGKYHCECFLDAEGRRASSFNLTLIPRDIHA
jgi:3-hydroxyacyl-[acyl-carrier-protein] dehydratase